MMFLIKYKVKIIFYIVFFDFYIFGEFLKFVKFLYLYVDRGFIFGIRYWYKKAFVWFFYV